MKQLHQPSSAISSCVEIAFQANHAVPDLWNSLTTHERIFVYYLYRASIPGNRIFADQTHRDAVELTDLCTMLYTRKDELAQQAPADFPVELFIKDLEIYLTYLYAHHGQYFIREYEHHKRTPARIGLSVLTPERLVQALALVGIQGAPALIARLHESIFNVENEPTLTVEGDIAVSAVNLYSPDFTAADFEQLSPADRSIINARMSVVQQDGKRVPYVERYGIGQRYDQELSTAHVWLDKARMHALANPELFDEHIPASLALLLKYLETCDEAYFKKFSIEWLQTKSRIDFNFGFVEVYSDPMQYRGAFEADVTVKVADMTVINKMLPSLEQQLPFPSSMKRVPVNGVLAMPNASVNAKLFASGDAGPVKSTAAYCLPNYAEIRSEHGSKQIMYQQGKGLGELVNPVLARDLFTIKEQVAWLDQHDAEGVLHHIIWDVLVLLHETLGHGSGRLAEHLFTAEDHLEIDGVGYNVGDRVAVTSENIVTFFGGYDSALEELRADIISLYVSIYHVQELAAIGLFKDWPERIGFDSLVDQIILHMAQDGVRRLITQADDAQEITQAHARANTAITNYLLDHGGVALVEEQYLHDNHSYTVVGVRLLDRHQAIRVIKELTIEIQRIKSTADGVALESFMKRYGTCVRYPQYIKTLKENRKAVQGELKEVAELYPDYKPVYDEKGVIIDIEAAWPTSFLEQHLMLWKMFERTIS
jgi:dipeptidyl-peptidase-3